tara:strand:- start:177 stop:665 length:489 start_codon:yes stop_codon:yes gene_type:complete
VYNPHTDIMNEVYLKQAYVYANNSQDLNTQNGALLIHPTKGILLGAYSSLPNRIQSTPDKWKSDCYVVSAEMNLLCKANERGLPTMGLIVCCPWFSSCESAKAIVQAGITKVITHKDMSTLMNYNVSMIEILQEAGIEYIQWEGKVGEDLFSIKVNGEDFFP